MLEILVSLAQDNPLLFGIVMFNIALALYILSYSALYLYKRRHPEIMLNVLLWKTHMRKSQSCSTIEELYATVMYRLRTERILTKKDCAGKLARDKSIRAVSGEKKDLLCAIYALYEQKIYGGKPIEEEEYAIRVLLGRVLSV